MFLVKIASKGTYVSESNSKLHKIIQDRGMGLALAISNFMSCHMQHELMCLTVVTQNHALTLSCPDLFAHS